LPGENDIKQPAGFLRLLLDDAAGGRLHVDARAAPAAVNCYFEEASAALLHKLQLALSTLSNRRNGIAGRLRLTGG
jgi:hypothetical protein